MQLSKILLAISFPSIKFEVPMSTLPIEVVPVTETLFGLDGGAMFGIIPRPLWTRTNPSDERNRIDLACRCLLVRYPNRDVLVDVGMGSRWDAKERDIYNVREQDIGLAKALADLKVDEITDVILTHLHFDHAGGVSRLNAQTNRVEPVFPNANHWVQRQNWGWANSPSARDSGSYRREELQIFEQDLARLNLIDGIAEILPGIEVIPVHGHTFGMQIVKITTTSGVFVHLADLIPTTSHLRDPYVMGYDLQPLVTVQEKREVLYHAARENWTLVFEHDPVTAMARVEFDAPGRPRIVDAT